MNFSAKIKHTSVIVPAKGGALPAGQVGTFGGKKITIVSLSAILLLGFAFPAGFFVQSQNKVSVASKDLNNAQAVNFVNVVFAQPNVTVVSVRPSQTQISSVCSVQPPQSVNALQGAADLNLNQPANCFSLEVDRSAVKKITLAVLPWHASVVHMVVTPGNPLYFSGQLAHVPPAEQIPVMPSLVLGLLAGLSFSYRKKFTGGESGAQKFLKVTSSPQQLQMLRC